MQKYKAVICDIDGTIIPDNPHALPNNRVKEAIRQAQEKLHFIFATGRPLSMLEYLLDEMSFAGLVIVDNGAVIYDAKKKKVLWETIIENKEANYVLQIASKYNKEIDISTNDGIIKGIRNKDKNINARKLCVVGMSSKEANHFIEIIERKFKNLAIVRASSYESAELFDIYITNAEATKQHAVLKIAEILGISTNEIIGIGDHYNDFPLLMACGLKVAMGNAVPELKEIADYIAPSVEEDGVAETINKFVL